MIYVLVPSHNHAATVGLLLWKVRQVFAAFGREYQLIAVNDGSGDATDEVLAPYARALPLTILTHRQSRGYAWSLEALFREALRRSDRPRRDLAITIPADFTATPELIPDVVKRLEGGADLVVADARASAGRLERLARSWLRRLTRRALGIVGADDVVGTLRGYRLAVLSRLVREVGESGLLAVEGWAADVELLARAARYARSVESVPVAAAAAPRARSRPHALPETLRALRIVWALRRRGGRAEPQPPATRADRAADSRAADVTRRPRRGRRGRQGGRGRGRPPASAGPPSSPSPSVA